MFVDLFCIGIISKVLFLYGATYIILINSFINMFRRLNIEITHALKSFDSLNGKINVPIVTT